MHMSCKANCMGGRNSKQLVAMTNQVLDMLEKSTGISKENITLELRRFETTNESDDPEITSF